MLCLLLRLMVCSQPVGLQWATSAGNATYHQSGKCVAAAKGAVYTAGTFQGTVDFDPGSGVFNLVSTGWNNPDIFVCRQDDSGKLIWAFPIQGAYREYANAIALDDSGCILLTGYLEGGADFDPGPGVHTLIARGMFGAFVAKYSPDGDLIWANVISGIPNGGAVGSCIQADQFQNVYVGGHYRDTVDFNPDSSARLQLVSAGKYDAFLLKLDAGGRFCWAVSAGGDQDDAAVGLALDANGYLYLGGMFSGRADLHPGTDTVFLQSKEAYDAFVMKLDTSGVFKWVKGMHGSGDNYPTAMAADSIGNVYVAGIFHGQTDFNPDPAKTYLLSAPGQQREAFVAKLDMQGGFLWAVQVGGTAWDIISSIALGPALDVYATGTFQGTADFNPDSAHQKLLSATGQSAGFILKLNNSGQYVWAIGVQSSIYMVGGGLALDGQRLYMNGSCRGEVDFDPDTGTFRLNSVFENAFTAAYNENDLTDLSQLALRHLQIFPNPVSAALHVALPLAEDTYHVRICLQSGQEITPKCFRDSGLLVIETQDLPPGLYVLRIFNDKQVYAQPFVKD